jgi:hypothetical protein
MRIDARKALQAIKPLKHIAVIRSSSATAFPMQCLQMPGIAP